MRIIEKIIKSTGIFLTILLAGQLLSQCTKIEEDSEPDIITPGNALTSYLNNEDTTYSWELQKSYNILDVKAYDLLLISQQWREYTWKHPLTIFIPPDIRYEGALLWITGGSLQEGLPKWASENDSETWALGILAASNQAVVAILRQTPNQPLYDGLKEDALISYTLHNFQNDGDYSWPLLFPMVKSAVRAMDAIQEFCKETENREINEFLVSGASKRGWTTWLTGASDLRVKAIEIPGENFIHYVANAGHDLNGGQQALRCISAFLGNTFAQVPYPQCSWEVSESTTGITLNVTGSADLIKNIYLWSASSQDRDFKDEEWSSTELDATDNSSVNTIVIYPETGFRAFYIDLKCTGVNGTYYTKSTRGFVTDNNKLL